VGEKEFQEIKERAEEVKQLMGYGSGQSMFLRKEVLGPVTLNLIENDVHRLVAEVEKLRAEQEPLRSNIPILKDEFSTRIVEEEERLRGIEASRADAKTRNDQVILQVIENDRNKPYELWCGSFDAEVNRLKTF